jgi:integrase
LGYFAGLRRAELAALTIGDIGREDERGLTVLVRRSKTDVAGAGHQLALWGNAAEPGICSVAAFEAWLEYRSLAADWDPLPPAAEPVLPEAWRAERPLFCGIDKGGRLSGQAMTDKVVARLLKQAALGAGLDPARFSGHSLRRGLLTDAGDRQLKPGRRHAPRCSAGPVPPTARPSGQRRGVRQLIGP